MGIRRKGKTGKQKSRNKENVVGFRPASLFPSRKWEAVTQGGTRGIDHLMQKRTQEAGIMKGWEEEQDLGCKSRYIHINQE